MPTNRMYPACCGIFLGVFHILFGMGSCGCGIASFIMKMQSSNIALGIWAGLFYLVTGILGAASCRRNNHVIAAFYTLSVFSVFVAMGQMGLYAWVIYAEIVLCWVDGDGNCSTDVYNGLIVAITIASIGFIEWILAMVSCCISCSCCCGSDPPPAQTIVIHSVQPAPPVQALHGNQPVMNVASAQPTHTEHRWGNAPVLIQSEQSPAGYGNRPPIVIDAGHGVGCSTHVNQGFSQEVSLPNTPYN